MLPPTIAERWAAIIEPCIDDPVLFVEAVIGARPDPWQAEVMRAFVEKKRAAIAGCNGSGKDCLATWLALWALCTRPYCKGQITGPGKDQVFDTVWPEFKKWIDHSPILPELLEWHKTRIAWKTAPERWFLSARTAAKRYSSKSGDAATEGIQGMHADHLIIIITEASGVEDLNWDAAESCCTQPDNYLLAVGNPLRREGRFYDIFKKGGFEGWYQRHVEYTECSQVNPETVQRWINQYGEDSAYVQVRAFGKFPKEGAEDAAIAWHLAYEATQREYKRRRAGDLQLGVDCARYGGDEFAIAPRVGNEVHELRTWKKSSGPQMVGHIIQAVKDYKGDKSTLIVVDEAGLGGSGVVDPLIQTHKYTNVRGVTTSMRPQNKQKYESWDDEQWLEVLPQFLRVAKLPDDEVLLAQLTTLRYEFTGKNEQQRRLESKEKMRRRGLSSPDRAEAVMLSRASYFGVPEPGITWVR